MSGLVCLLWQVEKCKTIIRECVKFCEEAEGDKAIPSEHYDSDGELPEKYIFCAKCLKGESEEVCACCPNSFWARLLKLVHAQKQESKRLLASKILSPQM